MVHGTGGVEVTGDEGFLMYENDGLRNPEYGDFGLLETLLGTSGKVLGFSLSSDLLCTFLSHFSTFSVDGNLSLLYNHLL